MSTKRVILANGSRLFREMLHHVINKAKNLEVVQELSDQEHLPPAIEQFDPEWVVVSSPRNRAEGRLHECMTQYPSVRFVVLSPDHSSIRLKSQATREQDLGHLSLNEFILILEKDLHQT
jgi:chemotaxis response regulator CheB